MTTIPLAVSNIAWGAECEPAVRQKLADLGVGAVEIAPTKTFEDPTRVSDAELAAYLAPWSDAGIAVVAFQSMLFGRPDLEILSPDTQWNTVERLRAFIELAGRMNVGILVFGSPRNRRLPAGSTEDAVWDQACEIFSRLGEYALAAGTTFCIEPNPAQYQCDFITDAATGTRLVRDVGNAGFRLHLDAAGMALAGDDAVASIRDASDVLAHYHASAPQLGAIETEVVDHAANLRALSEVGYAGYVSIEMRPADDEREIDRVEAAVGVLRDADARSRLI